MKILVNDGMSREGIEMLRTAGHYVEDTNIPQADLPSRIGEYDALVVRSATKVTREVINKAVNLKVIVRGGVGVDNIDVDYAQARGIKVLNTPGASSASVAELALAHMFALARFLVPANLSLREGRWEKKSFAKGVELGGKTLGILGLGRIGRELARRGLGLGMKVIAHDPYVTTTDLNVLLLSKDEVLARSDFVSLHMPAQESGPVLAAADFAKMKDGVFIINCARGGVVDEKALLEALNSGKVAGAGLDVFAGEPNPMPDLVRHPKVSVTPHIGASTVEAQKRIGTEVAQILIDLARRGEV